MECKDHEGIITTMVVRDCSECGKHTTGGAHKICVSCSLALLQCSVCRKPVEAPVVKKETILDFPLLRKKKAKKEEDPS